MKAFVLRICAVLVPFALAMAALVRVTYVAEWRLLTERLTFPTNVTAVAVGDSRVATDFDPAVLTGVRNCGVPAMPFEVTAQKAKRIAELNPHIRRFIIDMWPDPLFWRCAPFLTSAPDGTALFELHARENMPPWGDDFPVRLMRDVVRPGLYCLCGRPRGENRAVVGAFWTGDECILSNRWARPGAYDGMKAVEPEAPPLYMEGVLRELVGWMHAHGRKVVLTTAPMHRQLMAHRFTPEGLALFRERMRRVSDECGVPWHDRMEMYSARDEYWGDPWHLNAKGAAAYSQDLGVFLSTGD